MTALRSSAPGTGDASRSKLVFELVLLLTTVLVTSTVPPSSPLGVLRVVLGSMLVFFLPGYHLTTLLFEARLNALLRGALSIGLSIALATFIGLFFNFTPIGVTLESVLLALTVTTLLFLALATYRERPRT